MFGLVGYLLFLVSLWLTCLSFALGLAMPHSLKDRLSRPQVVLFISGVRSWIEWGCEFLAKMNQFQ